MPDYTESCVAVLSLLCLRSLRRHDRTELRQRNRAGWLNVSKRRVASSPQPQSSVRRKQHPGIQLLCNPAKAIALPNQVAPSRDLPG